MKDRMILTRVKNNKGSGLGVILYGVTLLLILVFTAVNIVNSKVIENGYNSLRDAVQTASSGAVIHLLTSERENATSAQKDIIREAEYDIYLQLALGYLINRNQTSSNDTFVQTGEINNFIKLDHQKVVNTTMALLEDAVIRNKVDAENKKILISDTDRYKIMMFFIEPYRDDESGAKYFDIIAYGNGDYKDSDGDGVYNIEGQLAKTIVKSSGTSMKDVYRNVERAISDIVNCKASTNNSYLIEYGSFDSNSYNVLSFDRDDNQNAKTEFNIKLNSTNDYDRLIREMETYPHYVIVVKDFALPTIFDSTDTNALKGVATSLSGDGKLRTPMCALNSGKTERQVEEANWSKNR